MHLKRLSLQNFRSYTKSSFDFSEGTTLIAGPNTAGKTNIIEAIFLLASGKSFRAEKDSQLLQFSKEVARISGTVDGSNGDIKLEVVLASQKEVHGDTLQKKYLVNGIAKRRLDFAGKFVCVLFSPSDLDIIIGSPSLRRNFLNDFLEQVDREYRFALSSFIKALRQRNALLEKTRDEGVRNEKQFEYWDNLLIGYGQTVTQKREAFINAFNRSVQDIFACEMVYDKSVVSKERLVQYKDAEVAAGVTLVGPHRDDFIVRWQGKDVKLFASRGQQRLAILQLRFFTLSFIKEIIDESPVLLLDDMFSELDELHIAHVFSLIGKQQTILTTTHKEFLDAKVLHDTTVIELD